VGTYHRPHSPERTACPSTPATMVGALGTVVLLVLLLNWTIVPEAVGIGSVNVFMQTPSALCSREIQYGAAGIQGYREYMEDRYDWSVTGSEHGYQLFGMFDGHGGDRASNFCQLHMLRTVRRMLEARRAGGVDGGEAESTPEWMEAALRSAFEEVDTSFVQYALAHHDVERERSELRYTLSPDLLRLEPLELSAEEIEEWSRPLSTYLPEHKRYLWHDGSTAVVAALSDDGQLVVANAGDSRGVMALIGEDGKITNVPLSRDHKPNSPPERKRIEDLGGYISFWGVWRVMGVLATSRSIGDIHLKPYVIPTPDFTTHSVSSSNPFFVLATDGVFDVMNGNQVIQFVADQLAQGQHPEEAAKQLVEAALAKGSGDNISALIVDLRPRFSSCAPMAGIDVE